MLGCGDWPGTKLNPAAFRALAIKQVWLAAPARPAASCCGMDACRFPATIGGQLTEGSMSFDLVAIDLGKQSFHLHGVSSDGVVLSRRVTRAKLFTTIHELAPTSIAMEACPGTHYSGRRFLGRRPSGAPDPSPVRQAVRSRCQERCRGCRGDLRCGQPSDDAVRAGEDDGAARSPGPASHPRAL